MSEPTIVPAQEPDRNDGKEWSAADKDDLALALRNGGSMEGAAYFLYRAGTVEEVRAKALELGLIEADAVPDCRELVP